MKKEFHDGDKGLWVVDLLCEEAPLYKHEMLASDQLERSLETMERLCFYTGLLEALEEDVHEDMREWKATMVIGRVEEVAIPNPRLSNGLDSEEEASNSDVEISNTSSINTTKRRDITDHRSQQSAPSKRSLTYAWDSATIHHTSIQEQHNLISSRETTPRENYDHQQNTRQRVPHINGVLEFPML